MKSILVALGVIAATAAFADNRQVTTAFSGTDMSGTYVGKGPNLAAMAQIVETSGGNFIGRYEEVTLKPDGRIEDLSVTIAGTRSGETVVATLKPGDVLRFFVSVPLSGTYRGGVLHLSGGTNLVLNLTSGTESDFRTQVAALTTQGQQISDARAQREAAQKQASQNEMSLLVADIQRQLYGCWHPPVGLASRTPVVVVNFSLNRDGSLAGPPVVKQSGTGPLGQAAVDSAVRAVRACTAPPVGPLHLPAAKYEFWREIEVGFDPKAMR